MDAPGRRKDGELVRREGAREGDASRNLHAEGGAAHRGDGTSATGRRRARGGSGQARGADGGGRSLAGGAARETARETAGGANGAEEWGTCEEVEVEEEAEAGVEVEVEIWARLLEQEEGRGVTEGG